MILCSEALKESVRQHGPVLGQPLSNWAVVGDCTNEVGGLWNPVLR